MRLTSSLPEFLFKNMYQSKYRPIDSTSQSVCEAVAIFCAELTLGLCLKIENAFCSTARVEVADMHCLPRLLQSSIRQTPFLASHLSTSSALQAKVLSSGAYFSTSTLTCKFSFAGQGAGLSGAQYQGLQPGFWPWY